MPTGIIQIASLAGQDKYLTLNPQITFFKKVYKRHTIFGNEIKEINFNNKKSYNNFTDVIIKNNGDLLSKMYLTFDLPIINFDDSIISNQNYLDFKLQQINNFNLKINKYKNLYNNLKNFSEIEILAYKQLLSTLKSENINIDSIKSIIENIVLPYDEERKELKLKIDLNLIESFDIIGYILGLENDLDNTNSNILIEIKKRYNNIQIYLRYYYNNYIYFVKKSNSINNKKIKYSFNKYLGENLITDYQLEIGGLIIEEYSNDILHNYNTHHIKESKREAYDKMIGNDKELYLYGEKELINRKITIPLNFFFNKNYLVALPLVALSNSSIKINMKINDIRNLLYLEDYEQDFKDLLILELPLDERQKLNVKTEIIDGYIYKYQFENITKELLDLKFPEIESDLLLSTYGNNNIIGLKEYIFMRQDLRNNDNFNLFTKLCIYDYHYYIDYNYIYNTINNPVIKLYGEFIYLDDIERQKFASNTLEYLVEIQNENIYKIKNNNVFDHQLDINGLVKDLSYLIRPEINTNGYTINHKKNYDQDNIYNNKILDKTEIYLNQFNIIKYDDNYYKLLIPYEHLNNQSKLNFYNFCINPEKNQPSGAINFSQIKGKVLKLFINKDFLNEYYDNKINRNNNIEFKIITTNYNLFIVQKGSGKLIFYQK